MASNKLPPKLPMVALSPDGAPEKLLTTAEAAEYLGIKEKTLGKWRREKLVGPKFTQLGLDGRSARYTMSELVAYVNSKSDGPIKI